MDHLLYDRRRPETLRDLLTYDQYLAQPTLCLWLEQEARRARNAAIRRAIAAPLTRLFRRVARAAAAPRAA